MEAVHPDDRALVAEDVLAAQQAGLPGSVEYRIRGDIRCRVNCRAAPHHHRLQGEKCPKFQGALRLSHAGSGRNALTLVGEHAEPPRVPVAPDAAGSGGHTSKHQQLPRPNPRRNAASAAGFVVACQKHEYFGSLRSSR